MNLRILSLILLSLSFLKAPPAAATPPCGVMPFLKNIIHSEHTFLDLKSLLAVEKKDTRFLWRQLSISSPTLGSLDNFTSPAVQDFIFSRTISSEAKKRLQTISREPSSIIDALKDKKFDLSSIAEKVISNTESHFRIMSEILNSAYFEKKGTLLLSSDQYPDELKIAIIAGLKEMNLRFQIPIIDEPSIGLISRLNVHPLIGSSLIDGTLKKDFIRGLPDLSDFKTVYKKVSKTLEQKLQEMPVGVSFRLKDDTSNVRFGERHFYSNFTAVSENSRRAIIKKSGPLNLMEAELRVSTSRKKDMAISLDRSHQSLDRIYGLEEKCGIKLNTCGTYAPMFFNRHGVPVVSFAYGTPAASVISLGIQRLLRLPNVKKFTMTHLSADSIMMVLGHDGSGVFLEYLFYSSVGSAAAVGGKAIYDLIDSKIVSSKPANH